MFKMDYNKMILKPNSKKELKIKELDALADLLHIWRSEGKRIVLSHGDFDLLHVGHIRHFEEAKAMGDILVVTVTPDEYVNKGPHRPAFPQSLRGNKTLSYCIFLCLRLVHCA